MSHYISYFMLIPFILGLSTSSILGSRDKGSPLSFCSLKDIHSVLPTQKETASHKQKLYSIHINPPAISKKDPLYWNWSKINETQIFFPEDFLWGVTTSAQQVEGNCSHNDWSVWEKNNKIAPTGSSCNHWKNYKSDIQCMKKIGLNTYRFSVEWSKIEPQEGRFNPEALQHYIEVCKELTAQNIKPVITLHHYTNPQWFAQKGGFEKVSNNQYFVRFATKVFEQLHSFAHLWITFSSPSSYVTRAYYKKLLPPGKENTQLMQEVLRNMLDAHVQTYQKIKGLPYGKKSMVGITHNIYQVEPSNFWDKPACSTANSIANDNIFTFFKTGHFNASVPFKVSVKHFNSQAPHSLDFIGLDYYSHGIMSGFNVKPFADEIRTQQEIYTIYPEGLYSAVHQLNTELAHPLNIPIYVTENGISTTNEKHRDLFFRRSLFALSYALHTGCPVKGYMVWSLMDNYDWGAYDAKFGLFEYNFKTQECAKEPRSGAQYLINVINH